MTPAEKYGYMAGYVSAGDEYREGLRRGLPESRLKALKGPAQREVAAEVEAKTECKDRQVPFEQYPNEQEPRK